MIVKRIIGTMIGGLLVFLPSAIFAEGTRRFYSDYGLPAAAPGLRLDLGPFSQESRYEFAGDYQNEPAPPEGVKVIRLQVNPAPRVPNPFGGFAILHLNGANQSFEAD